MNNWAVQVKLGINASNLRFFFFNVNTNFLKWVEICQNCGDSIYFIIITPTIIIIVRVKLYPSAFFRACIKNKGHSET